MRAGMVWMTAALFWPFAASAQSGQTQSRDGLGSGSPTQSAAPSNSLPAGALNAQTGPQGNPAYPSGSSTPNPGSAFVKTTPVPSTGPAQTSPGTLSTTTTGGGTTTGPGVGEAATPPK